MPKKTKTAAQLNREIREAITPNLTPFELALLRLHRRKPNGRKRPTVEIMDELTNAGLLHPFDRRDPESRRNRVTNAYADLRQKLGAQRGEGAVEAAERLGVRF